MQFGIHIILLVELKIGKCCVHFLLREFHLMLNEQLLLAIFCEQHLQILLRNLHQFFCRLRCLFYSCCRCHPLQVDQGILLVKRHLHKYLFAVVCHVHWQPKVTIDQLEPARAVVLFSRPAGFNKVAKARPFSTAVCVDWRFPQPNTAGTTSNALEDESVESRGFLSTLILLPLLLLPPPSPPPLLRLKMIRTRPQR